MALISRQCSQLSVIIKNWTNLHFQALYSNKYYQMRQVLNSRPSIPIIIITSKEPVCPRVELILKIIIILLIIFLGFIKSKPC